MDHSIVQSVCFADCPNKSSEAEAVLVRIGVTRCFEVIVQRAVLTVLILALLNMAFLGIALIPSTLHAATIAAASCSDADVRTSVTAARNGDTVLIPPGTCMWTRGLDSNCPQQFSSAGGDTSFCRSTTAGDTKYLTIQGAGVGQTIIIDAIPKNTGQTRQAISWLTNPGGLSRITGIEFRGSQGIGCGGGGTPNILIAGASNQVRIDHNKFVTHGRCPALEIGANHWFGVASSGFVRGVIDHNVFDVSGTPGVDPSAGLSGAGYCIYVFHQTWGGIGHDGDNSWAQPDTVGTAEAIFLEDNTFLNNQENGWFQTCIDGHEGARVVVRHNDFLGGTLWQNHGADTAVRSMRQYEVYENRWRGTDGTSAWNLQGNAAEAVGIMVPSRGGVGVIFNNSSLQTNGAIATASFHAAYFGVPADGRGRAGGFGFCNGTNPWDLNLVATGNPNNAGRRCLDQTGSGHGQLLQSNEVSGIDPINTVTRTKIWPQQIAQPTYGWNNTINGVIRGGVVGTIGGVSPISKGVDLIDGVRPGYTPYIYPHPLTTRATTSGSPPSPPTDLRVR